MAKPCKECNRNPISRPGGLCYGCFKLRYPNFSQPHPTQTLKDMRLVYAGKVAEDSTSEALRNLKVLFKENPGKFLELKDREEERYRLKVDAAWVEARAKDSPGQGEAELPREPVQDLIDELLGQLEGEGVLDAKPEGPPASGPGAAAG